jgi:carboxyl-terminal processing protease
VQFRGRTVIILVLAAALSGMFASAVLLTGPLADWWTSVREKTAGGDSRSAGFVSGLPDEAVDKLHMTYQMIMQRYLEKVDGELLVEGSIKGMLSALDDPYAAYIAAGDAEEYEHGLDSVFTGIGAEVSLEDGRVVVVSPIKGSPAEKAGIRPRDIILSVNGESLSGLTLTEAVQKIRGPKGSQAVLQIMREGQDKPLELIIVRDEIDLETVFSRMLDDRIGYMEIRQFSFNTVDSFHEQLTELEAQGMQALIIDVRNNPGGYLEGAAHILYELVPEGRTLVITEDRNGNRQELLSEGPGRDYPMAVLINGGSASASEILAAAVQQSAGGIVIGENSYGKGTVQSQYSNLFGDGSILKLTTSKWLTPDGTWINEVGVEPDKKVELPDYVHVFQISREKVWKRDDVGDGVKNLQIMLKALGYAPGRTDGYFSQQTEQALKLFQQKVNLEATGVLDEATIEQLELKMIEKLVDPESDLQLQAAIQTLSVELGKGEQ